MKLIDELFQRYVLIEDSLIPYGFSNNDNIYSYSKLIHNNEFELQIFIINNKIEAKLIDKEFDDEYNQINIATSGTFIVSLKDECSKILLDIRNNCFKRQYFLFPQSNRITELINDKYKVMPEFLWDSDPGFGVFRNKDNNKWFGIIMNIPKNKITSDSKEIIEVINLKLDEEVNYYLKQNGIYPAYHMTKKNWVSIILDDTLKDNELMLLIDKSMNTITNK